MGIRSKLPRVGTTIFTVMSQRAAELGAVNLGQGFPDYDIDPRLAELVHEAMRQGYNQYAPMPGMPQLREAIAAKLAQLRAGRRSGARGHRDARRHRGDLLGVQALVAAGDEVIVFDPAYDSYEPAVQLAGGVCVHVPLQPPLFRYDWERVRAALTGAHAPGDHQLAAQPGLHLYHGPGPVALARLLRGAGFA
jgi:methionine aminotransferase